MRRPTTRSPRGCARAGYVDAHGQRPELTLMVTGADQASRLAPAALRESDVLLLEPDANATLLRQLRARRAGRPVMLANLNTGEGIERVLAFIAARCRWVPSRPSRPPQQRKRSLWT